MPFSYRRRLFCPGPTPITDEVAHALGSNDYHRQAEFIALFQTCRQKLAELCASSEPPVLLVSSGSGAMEAAVVALTQPEEQVLVVRGSKFGARFQALTEIYHCQANTMKIKWGEGLDLNALEKHLVRCQNLRAIFLQANETTTGVHYPLQAVSRLVRKLHPDCLLVVDAISSLVAHQICIDAWGLDCVIGAGHKGFGLPPSLAFVFLSKRAQERFSARPRFYFDLQAEYQAQETGHSRFTPAISTVLALKQILNELLAIGSEELQNRHAMLASACRASVQALNLQVFARRQFSNALTAIRLPTTLQAADICAYLREKYQMQFTTAPSDKGEQLLRIAHLGFVDAFDLLAAVSALEFALHHFQHKCKIGTGVAAAVAELGKNIHRKC